MLISAGPPLTRAPSRCCSSQIAQRSSLALYALPVEHSRLDGRSSRRGMLLGLLGSAAALTIQRPQPALAELFPPGSASTSASGASPTTLAPAFESQAPSQTSAQRSSQFGTPPGAVTLAPDASGPSNGSSKPAYGSGSSAPPASSLPSSTTSTTTIITTNRITTLDDASLTDEAARRLMLEEDERRRRRKKSQGRLRELEEIRMELAEKELALLEKEKALLTKEQTLAVLAEELEVERKLRALLTKEKDRAEEEAALAMGLCTGGFALP